MAFKLMTRLIPVLAAASVATCQQSAPDTGSAPPTPSARPQFNAFATSSTAGPPTYTPIPTANPGPSAVDMQMDMLRKQEEAAQKRAQTAGLLSFLGCSLQSGRGKNGFDGILGCAGQGLQTTLAASMMSPGYSSYSFMSTGSMTSGGYTGGYTGGYMTSGGYTGGYTGGYMTSGGYTGGYTTSGGYTGGYTGGYRSPSTPYGTTGGYNTTSAWGQ